MASIKDITEPVKIYQQAKDAYHQNVLDFFDDLVKKSNTNLEANKSTCDEYYKKLTEIEAKRKASNKKGKLRTFLKVLMVICFITIVLIPVGILIRNKIKNKLELFFIDLLDKQSSNETKEIKLSKSTNLLIAELKAQIHGKLDLNAISKKLYYTKRGIKRQK